MMIFRSKKDKTPKIPSDNDSVGSNASATEPPYLKKVRKLKKKKVHNQFLPQFDFLQKARIVNRTLSQIFFFELNNNIFNDK